MLSEKEKDLIRRGVAELGTSGAANVFNMSRLALLGALSSIDGTQPGTIALIRQLLPTLEKILNDKHRAHKGHTYRAETTTGASKTPNLRGTRSR